MYLRLKPLLECPLFCLASSHHHNRPHVPSSDPVSPPQCDHMRTWHHPHHLLFRVLSLCTSRGSPQLGLWNRLTVALTVSYSYVPKQPCFSWGPVPTGSAWIVLNLIVEPHQWTLPSLPDVAGRRLRPLPAARGRAAIVRCCFCLWFILAPSGGGHVTVVKSFRSGKKIRKV